MSKRFISFLLCLILAIGLIPGSISADSIENFPYEPNIINRALALQAAKYAILANDNYNWDSAMDRYYMVTIKAAENTQPTQLINLLTQQSYTNIKHFNYDKTEENNSSFVLAQKNVMFNGEQKKLVVLSIRGTSGNQWKGNMDITGSKYGPETTHVGFELAANGVISELQKYLAGSNPKSNLLLITGYSRGASVANIIAHKLNSSIASSQDSNGIDKLYAYTFATPNLTTVADKNEANIFNFCFSDDFIPQVPLKATWGYDKHGKTYEVAAADLYSSNNKFKEETDKNATSLTDLNGNKRTKASFNKDATQKVIASLNQSWPTLESYYNEKCPINVNDLTQKATLYEYSRNSVATAIAGDTSSMLSSIFTIPADSKFKYFSGFIVSGYTSGYLFDSHSMATYYSALKNDLFNINYPVPTIAPSNAQIQTSTPTSQVVATPSSTIAPTSATAKNEPGGKIPSSDVLKDIQKHWAKENIAKLVSLKIINGYEDSTFKPDNTITRAELASIIVKALELPLQSGDTKFTDDKSIPAWAKSYVKTASEKGIINGYKDLTFRPSQPCTRQEIVTMIMKAFEFGKSDNAIKLKDLNQIQDWSKGYVSKAIELEIVKGYLDMTFKPNKQVSRAEAATMILKSIEVKKL